MGIESIASQLYTISSKKKVPLKAAFSIMVKEEMAARFSVYNLVKTATKSSLLAMLAHRAYGKETPEQRKEREEAEKKDDIEKKFKKFTVNSLVNLNNKVNLLSAVTERNSALIMQLFNDLGYFKNQKRFNPNTNQPLMRVPLREKTIKGKLDELNDEIEKLKAAGSKLESAKKGAKDKKKPEKKDEPTVPAPDAGKLGMLAQFAADNPRLAAVLEPVLAALGLTGGVAAVGAAGGAVTGTGAAAGAARALGGAASLTRLGVTAGGLVASGVVLSQLPKAISDTATRFEGGSVGTDKYGEGINRMYTNVMLPAGAYVATTGAINIYDRLRDWQLKKQHNLPPGQQTRINKYLKQLEALEKKLVAKGMPADDARKAVQAAIDKIAKFGIGDAARLNLPPLDSKWFKFAKASKGILKRLPGANAALVAYEISKMSGYYADRHTGAMSAEDYKKNMSRGYASIAETVGTTVMGALIGAAAGTMFAGPLGTAVGALGGIAVGGITSLFIDDEKGFMNDAGVKIFEMIHEDKKPAPAAAPPAKPTAERAEQKRQDQAQTRAAPPVASPAPPPEQPAAPAPSETPSKPEPAQTSVATSTTIPGSESLDPSGMSDLSNAYGFVSQDDGNYNAGWTPSPLLAGLTAAEQKEANNWAWSMYIGEHTMQDVPEKYKKVSGDILSLHLPPNWYAEREKYREAKVATKPEVEPAAQPPVQAPAKPSPPVTVPPESTLVDLNPPTPTLPTAEEITAPTKSKTDSRSQTQRQVDSLSTAVSREQIKDIIIDAADKVGIDAGIMLAMGKQESGFDPNAGASTSSAKGLFQFLKSTWKGISKKYGTQYPELQKGRLDPEANAIAGALFIKENAAVLRSADIPVTGANIYAAHFLGAAGAKTLLKADDKVLANSLLPSAAKSNLFVFYKKKGKKIDTSQPRTVGEIKEFLFHVTASAESYSDRVKQRRDERAKTPVAAAETKPAEPAAKPAEKPPTAEAPEKGEQAQPQPPAAPKKDEAAAQPTATQTAAQPGQQVATPSVPVSPEEQQAKNWAWSMYIGKATMEQVPPAYKKRAGRILSMELPQHWYAARETLRKEEAEAAKEPKVTKTQADKAYDAQVTVMQKLLSDGKIDQKEFEKQVTLLDQSRKSTNEKLTSQRQAGPAVNQSAIQFLQQKFPNAKAGNRYWVNGVRYAFTPYSADITGTGKGQRNVWYVDYDANNPNKTHTEINPEGAKLLAQQKWTGPDKAVSEIKLIVEAEKAKTETKQAEKYRREKAEAAGVSMPPEETATPTQGATQAQTVATPTASAEDTEKASGIFFGTEDWAWSVYSGKVKIDDVPRQYRNDVIDRVNSPPAGWVDERKALGVKEEDVQLPVSLDKIEQAADTTETERESRIFYGAEDYAYMVYTRRATLAEVPENYKTEIDKYLANPPIAWIQEAKDKGLEIPAAHAAKLLNEEAVRMETPTTPTATPETTPATPTVAAVSEATPAATTTPTATPVVPATSTPVAPTPGFISPAPTGKGDELGKTSEELSAKTETVMDWLTKEGSKIVTTSGTISRLVGAEGNIEQAKLNLANSEAGLVEIQNCRNTIDQILEQIDAFGYDRTYIVEAMRIGNSYANDALNNIARGKKSITAYEEARAQNKPETVASPPTPPSAAAQPTPSVAADATTTSTSTSETATPVLTPPQVIDAVDAASVAQTATSAPLGALGISTANPAQAVAESLGLTEQQVAESENYWLWQLINGKQPESVQTPASAEPAPTATPVVTPPPIVAATPNQVVESPPKIEEPVVTSEVDDDKPDPMDAIAAQSTATMGAMSTIVGAIRQLSEKVAMIENTMPKTEFPKVLNQEPSIAAYAESISPEQFVIRDTILKTIT